MTTLIVPAVSAGRISSCVIKKLAAEFMGTAWLVFGFAIVATAMFWGFLAMTGALWWP